MVSPRRKVSRTAISTMKFFKGQTRTRKSLTNMFQTPLPTTRLKHHLYKLIRKGDQHHLKSDFNYKVNSSVASFEFSWAKHLRAKFDPISMIMIATVKLIARDNTPVRWWPSGCQVMFGVSKIWKLYLVDRQTTTLFSSNSSRSQWPAFLIDLNSTPVASISLAATLTKFIIPP